MYDVVVFCFNDKTEVIRDDSYDKVEYGGGLT